MVTSLPVGITAEIIYPDRDGNPMSDNTKQFSWIVKIKENIELLCADDPDILWQGIYCGIPLKPFMDFVDNARLRQAAENRATLAEIQAQKLAVKLRELGIDPDSL